MILAMFQDLRRAAHSLMQSRGFIWAAVITLALGIASNITVFTVINAVLLHPLPYSHPERLVILHWQDKYGSQGDISARAFFMLKEQASTLQNMTVIYPLGMGVNLSGVRSPEFVKTLRVSQDFFRTLDVAPLFGRDFLPEEDRPGGAPVAILSYAAWQHNFNGDDRVIGSQFRINSEGYTVVGVMPKQFHFYPEADLWVPLKLSPTTADTGSDYRVIARLKDASSLEQSRLELQSLSGRFGLTYLADSAKAIVVPQSFPDFLFSDVRKGLAILSSAVFLVLMIGCTNVAILCLVRASARSHEIAVRVALGSNRPRLARFFLTEGILIGASGSLVGIILAKESTPLVLRLLPADLPLNASVGIDWRVLLFAATLSCLTSVFFGLAPALKLSHIHLGEMLQLAPRGGTSSPKQARTGRILISAQIALTLVLLTGASLLLQDFLHVHEVKPGFDPRNVFVAQISLASKNYRATEPTQRLVEKIREQLQRVPHIEAISSVNGLPLEKGLNLPLYSVDSPTQIEHVVEYRIVSSDYLGVMKIPLIGGRNFSPSDVPGSEPVAIVNQTLARRWWPDTSPVGRFVNIAREAGPQFSDLRQVIGVAADIHEAGLEKPAPPTVFVPVTQVPDNITALANQWFLTSIMVRSSDSKSISEEIHSAVSSADPDLPVSSVRPLTQVISESLARQRFYAFLVSSFGGLALLLTAVGLYGLLSYQVGLRTREIAVRMAVGATRAKVVMLTTAQAARLVATGMLLGLIGAFFLRRLIQKVLPGFTSISSGLLLAAFILGTVAVIVTFALTVRAASIQPMKILRQG